MTPLLVRAAGWMLSGWWGGLVVLCLLSLVGAGGAGWGLVGGVFEKWIVDASIWQRLVRRLPPGLCGGGGVVVVV